MQKSQKVRDSGMPDIELWESFFQPRNLLKEMGLAEGMKQVVDFGCGYGTFTLPAAEITRGNVLGIDLDTSALTIARERCRHLPNIELRQRDFIAQGSGAPAAFADYVMIFNLLHTEAPLDLLQEATRILHPGGLLGVIHWVSDRDTPRGPDLSIRPRPEQCRHWLEQTQFDIKQPYVDLPPYHFGIVAAK